MSPHFTEQGLVEHCHRALKEKWGYVWGTFGEVLTEKLLAEKLRQYPEQVGQYYEFIRRNWLNKPTVDCIGLIKSYIWQDKNGLVYNLSTDKSTDHLFHDAREKGTINSLQPNMIGKCLWKPGHVGVYIGDGMVIESRGTLHGVIKTPIQAGGSTEWTHWFTCPWLQTPEVEYGYPGIKTLQEKLNTVGYSLTVDGILGPQTKQAITHFQSNNNLMVDGVVDVRFKSKLEELIMRLTGPKRKSYIELLKENTDRAVDWIKAIDTAVAASKADGNLGDLEIFKFLPTLLEKIGNKK